MKIGQDSKQKLAEGGGSGGGASQDVPETWDGGGSRVSMKVTVTLTINNGGYGS